VSAITLWVKQMDRSVAFYRALGFETLYGGEGEPFTSFRVGPNFLNLATVTAAGKIPAWGRVIFYVADVDAFYALALDAGFTPDFAPRDARWGERYFHLSDPDGHALSFAAPLPQGVGESGPTKRGRKAGS
jgi:catechol 2,3-dioxygenase-like lactoylglutathione lyase family enzyme